MVEFSGRLLLEVCEYLLRLLEKIGAIGSQRVRRERLEFVGDPLMRGAFRLIFYGGDGDIKSRALEAKTNWSGVAEVAEIADFILAPAKQNLCTARRRGEAE